MTLPRIQYEENVPGEIGAVVAPLLERWHHLIPAWVHHLRIRYEQDNTDDTANCRPFMEYRQVRISLCASFLTLTPDERDRAIAHELLHLVLEPLQNAHADCLDMIKEKFPDAHKYLLEARRHGTESAISDLLHIVRPTLAPPP